MFETYADLEMSLRIEAQIEYGAVMDLYVFKVGMSGRETDITDFLTTAELKDLQKWALDQYHKKNPRRRESDDPQNDVDPMDEVDRIHDYDRLRYGGAR